MSKNYLKFFILMILLFVALPTVYFFDIESETVTHIKKVNYNQQLEVTGTIISSESTPISLSYPIYIKKCFVSENSYVNKGQLLFEIDTEKMAEAVKSNNLTQYTEEYAALDKEAFADISREIYATESGYVREIVATEGSFVLANENLCVIDGDSDLLLKIILNQEDYTDISVGDRINFSPAIAPSRTYYGTVCDKTAVVRKETSLTGSKTVIDIFAEIEQSDEYITQGLQFSGIISKNEDKILNTLPYEFINQDDNGEYVYVHSDDNTEKVYIETGIETADYAEIITDFDEKTIFIKSADKGKKLLKYE